MCSTIADAPFHARSFEALPAAGRTVLQLCDLQDEQIQQSVQEARQSGTADVNTGAVWPW